MLLNRLAEAIISDSNTLAKADTGINKSQYGTIALRQEDTRVLLSKLARFDPDEKDALVSRLIEPDLGKKLAYVPKDFLERVYAINKN